MAEGQYSRNVQPLRLRTELIYPSFRGKIADFPLVYDRACHPDAPVYIETYHAYAPGAGVMAPSELAPVIDGRPVDALKNVGQHAHNDFDEVYFFYGTDPTGQHPAGRPGGDVAGQRRGCREVHHEGPHRGLCPEGVGPQPLDRHQGHRPEAAHHGDERRLHQGLQLPGDAAATELPLSPDVLPRPDRGCPAR